MYLEFARMNCYSSMMIGGVLSRRLSGMNLEKCTG